MWAAVPVKTFARSKQRLAPVLDPGQRVALAEAMLRDVLTALTACPGLDGILVISRDPAALEIGAAFGVRGEEEDTPTGYNQAVAQAARSLAGLGAQAMLVLPADVPLVTPDELQQLIAGHGAAAGASIVADRGRGGTNAMLLSPPDLIAPSFGDDSFARHCAAARAVGVEPLTPVLPGLALDIDLPEDLRLLQQQDGASESGRLLQQFDAQARRSRPIGQ